MNHLEDAPSADDCIHDEDILTTAGVWNRYFIQRNPEIVCPFNSVHSFQLCDLWLQLNFEKNGSFENEDHTAVTMTARPHDRQRQTDRQADVRGQPAYSTASPTTLWCLQQHYLLLLSLAKRRSFHAAVRRCCNCHSTGRSHHWSTIIINVCRAERFWSTTRSICFDFRFTERLLACL